MGSFDNVLSGEFDKDLSFYVNYDFTSQLQTGRFSDLYQYISEINGEITVYDGQPFSGSESVGKVKLFLIHFDLAFSEGFNPSDIFDCEESVLYIMEHIFNFKKSDFKKETGKVKLPRPNILIMDRLEILPKYRGKGLGRVVIKDIVNKIGNTCKIIALKAYAPQHEASFENDEWRSEMKLSSFENDQKKAQDKLENYYQKMGFIKFGKTDILTLVP